MLKYGMFAKCVEFLCSKEALKKLHEIYPNMDIKNYKKKVKLEYK